MENAAAKIRCVATGGNTTPKRERDASAPVLHGDLTDLLQAHTDQQQGRIQNMLEENSGATKKGAGTWAQGCRHFWAQAQPLGLKMWHKCETRVNIT